MVKSILYLSSIGLALGEPSRFLSLKNSPSFDVPRGVNFGGWLCLEDWFYSGVEGTAVSTGADSPNGQGACLPPLATQLTDNWPSEGALAKRLNLSHGPAQTSQIFMAHRREYIGTRDLEAVRELGIKTIRVPITWAAFADALTPIDKYSYGSHNPEDDAVLVPDPFYAETRALVTIPRNWLKQFLKKVRDHGLQVIFDLHAMPGASSDGTYNSVWPKPPAFWKNKATIGDTTIQLTEAGHMITDAAIKWVESLTDLERKAVKGLTLMNEPAHLSANADWAEEKQVLDWLARANDQFRKSSLPGKGVKSYINMIETTFKDFGKTVPPWFNNTFTEVERSTWAVMDIHWYSAWGGGWSSGRTVDGGAYHCDDPIDEIRPILQRAIDGYVSSFRANFGDIAAKAISEFSLGTFDQTLQACHDPAVLEMFLDMQVKSFDAAGIEPFFWTWRMPYGSSFEPGWSLKYVTGNERPHEPLQCKPPRYTGLNEWKVGNFEI